MEAEVWRGEVGWEKMGLGGGGCKVYVACWMCLFRDGLGRDDSKRGEWVLKEYDLVCFLEDFWGLPLLAQSSIGFRSLALILSLCIVPGREMDIPLLDSNRENPK